MRPFSLAILFCYFRESYGSMNFRLAMANAWPDLIRVLLHPLLDEPELAAASSDRVLAGRVERPCDPRQVPASRPLCAAPAGWRGLAATRPGGCLVRPGACLHSPGVSTSPTSRFRRPGAPGRFNLSKTVRRG